MRREKSIFVKKISYNGRQVLMDRRNDHYYLKEGNIPAFDGWLEINILNFNCKDKYFDSYGNEYRYKKNSIYAN